MLFEWGWDGTWAAALEHSARLPGERPGRVTGQDRGRWTVQLEDGVRAARVVGSLQGPLPVTGDWVTARDGPLPADPLTIGCVLPRRSAVSRGRAGAGDAEQVLAANVDVIWIVQGLDRPVNLRALERYLAVAWDSGSVPEVVLTKADLVPDPAAALAEAATVCAGVAIHLASVQLAETVDDLRSRLAPGRTVALLGPSGAGKSTLVNALAGGPLAATGEVREFDHKGRHTTTRRELFRIPGGALLLDTPGLRELRVWALEDGLGCAFPEIEDLAAACRFRDCSHDVEPGCAVLAAVEAGRIEPDRLASYRKLQSEAAYLERKIDHEAHAAAVAKHKTALRTLRFHPKYRREET